MTCFALLEIVAENPLWHKKLQRNFIAAVVPEDAKAMAQMASGGTNPGKFKRRNVLYPRYIMIYQDIMPGLEVAR